MTQRNSDAIVFSYNRRAMEFLRNEDYKTALTYLSKAEELLNTGSVSNLHKLYGITLNNFGCFYKRTGNPSLALNFLRKALEIETKPPVDINNLAGTHLNICAILSQIEDHHKALSHALKALNLLKSRYLDDPSLLTTLLVAHHNSGVEYEFLSQTSDAFGIYQKGWKIASDNLGDAHALSMSLKNSMQNTNFTRRNTVSPMRNSQFTPVAKSRGSVPRSYKTSKKGSLKKLDKPESVRFVTGERLQPMFKHEKVVKKKFTMRDKRKYDVSSLIKELNGESSRDVKDFSMDAESSKGLKDFSIDEDSENDRFFDTVSTVKEKSISVELPSERTQEAKISISTQVDFKERNVFKNLRNNAASIIQKYCRGFLARKKKDYEKYSKQLEEAELQAKIAKEKLRKMGRFGGKKLKKKIELPHVPVIVPPSKNEELIPIAYKSKLNSAVRSDSRMSSVTPRYSEKLPVIPEETEAISYKVISIQSHLRGWVVRKEYILKRAAIIMIQKHLKRYLIRKLFLQIKDAIVFIQKYWRKQLIYKRQKKALTLAKKSSSRFHK